MLVTIEAVAMPAKDGMREIRPFVYTMSDGRETPSEVRDANHAKQIVENLTTKDSVFIAGEPPRTPARDTMWVVQISVLATRHKFTHYRIGYKKFNGCPLSAIGWMMEIYHAIKRILKSSRKEEKVNK